VQHEGEPLGRTQGVEHDEQRQPNRVGEQYLLLGALSVVETDDRVGHVRDQQLLRPRVARFQRVQAHAGADRGQPSAQVLDVVTVGAAESKPGFLNRVVRLDQRAEHPVGDCPQVGALFLEAIGQKLVLVHRSHFRVARRHRDRQTNAIRCDSS
jgi:hypothetical protein